jgi:RNA polymerase sigma-70 factor (ECF subfamily)
VIEMARVERPVLGVHTSWRDRPDHAEAEPGTATPVAAPAVRAMDAVALGAAFEREAPVLLAAARAITFDAAEAEDLVQTTFELAIRNVHQLKEPEALRAWLLTIQTREAFRIIRRFRRGLGLRSSGGVLDIAVAPVASTDHIVIRDALRGLPPRMRAVVVLHHMAGMTVPQVARAVGRSENTVRSQLRVGLQRLREALRDD